MQRSDIRAVGDLAGEASSVVTTLVRGMHAGIASRVFGSIGPSATPTRAIHDGLTRAIYAGVDRGMRGATHAAGALAAEIWGDEADEALESRTSSAAAAIAAVNGLYGHQLTERENPLAGAMVIRHRGKPVALTTDSLAAAFPAAAGRVASFCTAGALPSGHGLGGPARAKTTAAMANGWATILDSAQFFCGTTPDCMCRSTAERSPKFSTCCTPSGRSPSATSCWWVTRWADWWRAALATMAPSNNLDGPMPSVMLCALARRIWGPIWKRV